jgi:cysteine synthase A
MISDNSQTRLWIGLSFVAGILITLGYKDVYPDLERRFRRKLRRRATLPSTHYGVQLIDKNDKKLVKIPEGIEACIGNTPLFKIRSLSEATGCEIYAKAEVILVLVHHEAI